jgi:hypothetical protein
VLWKLAASQVAVLGAQFKAFLLCRLFCSLVLREVSQIVTAFHAFVF